MKLILLGSPGVGKGTYTQELVKDLNIVQISTGDIFRENIKSKTVLGQKVENYLSTGKLVPDELVIEIVRERLKEKDCQKGFILDGFPRTLRQAEALDKITKIDLVLNFKADHQVIIDRLSGRRICRSCKWIYHLKNSPTKIDGQCDKCEGETFHRPDDFPEAIQKRLSVYETETAPLIDYYKKKGLLREVVVNEEFSKYREEIMNRIHLALGLKNHL